MYRHLFDLWIHGCCGQWCHPSWPLTSSLGGWLFSLTRQFAARPAKGMHELAHNLERWLHSRSQFGLHYRQVPLTWLCLLSWDLSFFHQLRVWALFKQRDGNETSLRNYPKTKISDASCLYITKWGNQILMRLYLWGDDTFSGFLTGVRGMGKVEKGVWHNVCAWGRYMSLLRERER